LRNCGPLPQVRQFFRVFGETPMIRAASLLVMLGDKVPLRSLRNDRQEIATPTKRGDATASLFAR